MSWNPPKPGINYRVKVFIVDDTYWDDGNRTTNRAHDFATLAEAVAFKAKTVEAGRYATTSWVTDEPLERGIDADDVQLYKWDVGEPGKTIGWVTLKDDAITLLGGLNDSQG